MRTKLWGEVGLLAAAAVAEDRAEREHAVEFPSVALWSETNSLPSENGHFGPFAPPITTRRIR